jgi:hypothetical protein
MLKSPFKPNFLYIVGQSLRKLAGHELKYGSIVFMNCDNVPKYEPLPNFADAKNIGLVNCDENFVDDWLKHKHFPAVKKIYLNSDPVEPDTLTPFHLPNIPIYLHQRYDIKICQWEKIMPLDHVQILSDEEMEKQILNMADGNSADFICDLQHKDSGIVTIGQFHEKLYYCKDIKNQHNSIGQNLTEFVQVPDNNIDYLDDIMD